MIVKIQDANKIEIFTSIFQNIKNITENMCVYFEKERLFIQTMDGSRVSILEVIIPSSWFDFYDCNGTKIGLNTNIIHKILSCKDKTQTLHLEYLENDSDKLYVNMMNEMEDSKQKVYERYFEVPLIEFDEELMEIPPVEYDAEITIPSSNFSTLIHQLKGFGDVLNIQCDEENIQFISKSTENGSMRVEVPIEDLLGFSIVENETLNVSFGLQYLNTICAYNKLSKNVVLKIHKEYPLEIEYIFDENGGCIKYLLAPKIMED